MHIIYINVSYPVAGVVVGGISVCMGSAGGEVVVLV